MQPRMWEAEAGVPKLLGLRSPLKNARNREGRVGGPRACGKETESGVWSPNSWTSRCHWFTGNREWSARTDFWTPIAAGSYRRAENGGCLQAKDEPGLRELGNCGLAHEQKSLARGGYLRAQGSLLWEA